MLMDSDRNQFNGLLRPQCINGGGWVTGKGQEGTLGAKKNVLYLDCVGGYTDGYIHQNSLNCTLETRAFYIV